MVSLNRNGCFLLWFLLALIALANMLIVLALQRRPLQMKAPLRLVSAHARDVNDRDSVNIANFKGEVEFVNAHRAILQIRVRDKLLQYEPAYTAEIFQDGVHYDSLSGPVENMRLLPEGNHTYRIVSEITLKTRAFPQIASEMNILVEYPSDPSRWQGPGLIGIGFLMIGTFQLLRVPERSRRKDNTT